jgi:hypothetical protein
VVGGYLDVVVYGIDARYCAREVSCEGFVVPEVVFKVVGQ